ncbi:MAG TPA: DUF6325 family protein [Pseudonocardiaceae bacterium]|nr:DUF6325 family protein [Pseudonocardiaceae bacterium]
MLSESRRQDSTETYPHDEIRTGPRACGDRFRSFLPGCRTVAGSGTHPAQPPTINSFSAARQGHRMTTDIRDRIGPIDYMIIEFPGDRPTGEGLTLLVDLVGRAIVRLLDLVFISKQLDGSVIRLALTDIDGDGDGDGDDTVDLAVFEATSPGMIDADDVNEVDAVLLPNSSAAIVIYENLWAVPLAAALRGHGAQVVAGGRIGHTDILAGLDGCDITDTSTRQG